MKKYILSTLCVFSSMSGMLPEETQQIIQREAREWDAQAYAQGNIIQEEAALQFLKESGIDFTNKKVLDVGCGTGNITAEIAKTAKHVHGIDASKNMIEYAQKTYGDKSNLSFEQSFAEDFTPKKPFNVAFTFFCLHWIQDKQQAFTRINRALQNNGDFFGTYQSSSDPEPYHFTVLKEILPTLSSMASFSPEDFATTVDYFVTSDEEAKTLLQSTGFEIMSFQQKSIDLGLTRAEIENAIWPVLQSRPFMRKMSYPQKTAFFTILIDKLLAKFTAENDFYVIPAGLCTKVFHARKIAEL